MEALKQIHCNFLLKKIDNFFVDIFSPQFFAIKPGSDPDLSVSLDPCPATMTVI
jgi:hypothetical protein